MGAKQKCIHKVKIEHEIQSRLPDEENYIIKKLYCDLRKILIVSENKAYHITTCTGCRLREPK
jgi:hypothetical protein